MTKRNLANATILSVISFALFACAGYASAQTSDCRTINVVSSIDSVTRDARICKWGGDNAPLLVFFPAWSGGHPYFEEVSKLASDRRWNMVAPKPRGANEGEIGSILAIQDVLDAISLFKERDVAPKRIYALGVSGGGYMALMTAAKYPELFHGVSVWAAMTDLKDWRSEMAQRKSEQYVSEIDRALGSPDVNLSSYLSASPINFSKELRSVKIDLNAGLTDGHHGTVSVTHSLNLFNSIANPKNRLSQIDFEKLSAGKNTLFPQLVKDEAYGNKRVLFRRSSGNIRLTVFDGDHEMVPTAAINWLSLH